MDELYWFYSRFSADVEKEMNANELADELERVGCTTYCRCEETIPMLRTIPALEAEIEKWKDVIVKQQGHVCNLHAEIEELKAEMDKAIKSAEVIK
jgi:hypothetical protein